MMHTGAFDGLVGRAEAVSHSCESAGSTREYFVERLILDGIAMGIQR